MVGWSGDGLVSGYDPTTKKHKQGVFHLASPGSVDTNGGTRLQWDLVAGYPSRSSYPNELKITAAITFSTADFNATPTRDLGMAAVLVKASKFAAGVTPTPQQIFDAYVDASSKGDHYAEEGSTGPVTVNATMHFVNAEMDANTKYWLLVYPASINAPASAWSKSNYKPIGSLNTNARAISIWTNRTPAAPTITSPPSGSVIPAGETFQFSYTPNDPDKLTPNDTLRSNHDLAGVEVQYAPIPTTANPTPEWSPLKYWLEDGAVNPAPFWASVTVGSSGSGYPIEILRDLGFPISAAVPSDEMQAKHGGLPAGDWQIRVRVADFGHPYPNIVMPGGRWPPASMWDSAENVSPWSTPVRISIPSQTPPPIPLSPRDDVATEEGTTVRLSWQYRNTANPPYAQAERWVQIRKVGDPEWSTVFAGVSGNSYVDLPAVYTSPTPTPDQEYLADGDFEAGTTDGWVGKTSTDFNDNLDFFAPNSTGVSLTNVNDPALAHTGDRFLRLDNTGAEDDWPVLTYSATIGDPAQNAFRMNMWFLPPPEAVDLETGEPVPAVMKLMFLDEDDTIIPPTGDVLSYRIVVVERPSGGWSWVNFNVPELMVPAGAVKVLIAVSVFGIEVGGDAALLSGLRLDDVSLVGYSTFNTVDFTMGSTTQYEWRVQVRDASGLLSDYSETARFWVVPSPASGTERPIPDSTTDGATLGCGTHKVFVYRRGGLERVGEIRGITHVDWGRLRDDISTSKVVIEDWDIDCGNLLARLQTWAYELVIFRDNGFSVERVWEGPITLLTYEQDKVTIQAKDVMAYPYRRIIKQRMSDAGTGNGRTVTARAAQVIQNVMAPDDPNVLAYLQVITHSDDAMQYRSTPAYSRTAFEEVDDMAANSGLDYTAVGRSILLWSTRHRIGTLPEFRDENLGSAPIVSEYGMSMANLYSVSDGNGVHGESDRLTHTEGEVSGNDPIYGLVEMLSSTWASDSEEDTGTYTEAGLETVRRSFEEFAERSIADRYPPPVVVRVPDNTTIHPDTVLSIQQLVPGVVIPLRSSGTLREVIGNQKLDSVNVVEEGGKETISITLSPFNRDDVASGDDGGEE